MSCASLLTSRTCFHRSFSLHHFSTSHIYTRATSQNSTAKARTAKQIVLNPSTHHQHTVAMESFVTVPELFEELLDQLPFLDLVIATGVNATFRNFIASSQRLQRKLFLLPNKPCGSKEHRRRFDKKGIFGAYMSSNTCLDASANLDSPPVTLCPFLLEPSHSPRTAHLSIRAAKARFWPFMYLTQPPCVHAHVQFAYGGINEHGMYVLVEAGRTIYRRGGVTLAAIEEALSQSGSVQVSRGQSNMSSTRGCSKVEATKDPPLTGLQ